MAGGRGQPRGGGVAILETVASPVVTRRALESGPRGATSSDSHSEDVTWTPCTARGRAV